MLNYESWVRARAADSWPTWCLAQQPRKRGSRQKVANIVVQTSPICKLPANILNHATLGWKHRQNVGYWIISKTRFPTRFDMNWTVFSQSSIFLSHKTMQRFHRMCQLKKNRRILQDFARFSKCFDWKKPLFIVHLLRALKASVENKCTFANCRG